MSDREKIEMLRNALAALLRQTAGEIDPIHPAFQKARKDAADAFQKTVPLP